jgi:hypothetical protein
MSHTHRTTHKSTGRQPIGQLAPRNVPQPQEPQHVSQDEEPFEIELVVPESLAAQGTPAEEQQQEDHDVNTEDKDDEEYSPLSDTEVKKMYRYADEVGSFGAEALVPTDRLQALLVHLCSWPKAREEPESPEKKPVRRRSVFVDLGCAWRDRVGVATASYGVCLSSTPSPPLLRRAAVVGATSRRQPDTMETAWPGAGSRRGWCRHSDDTTSARLRHDDDTPSATSPHRLDGDGLLRLDSSMGESSTKAMTVWSDDDELRSGPDEPRSGLGSFFYFQILIFDVG